MAIRQRVEVIKDGTTESFSIKLTKRDFSSVVRLEARLRNTASLSEIPLREQLVFAVKNEKLLTIFRKLPRSIPLQYYKQAFLLLFDDDLKWLWDDFSFVFPDESYSILVMKKSEINIRNSAKMINSWKAEEALSPAMPYKSQKYYHDIKRINPALDDDILRFIAFEWAKGSIDKLSALMLLYHQDPFRR